MSLEHGSDETLVNAKVVIHEIHVKVQYSTTFLKKNEERCTTYTSTTSNPIQSDNEHQFTKLAKEKSRVKDIQIDSVIQTHPDERMH